MHASRLTPFLSLALVVAACSTSAGPTPSPSPSPSASGAGDFTLEVLPAEELTANRMAIPGSGYAFLVVMQDAPGSPAGGPITITATASGAAIDEVLPVDLQPGVVGEVWVVADPATAETSGSVTITGARGGISHSVTRTLPVFPMEDTRAAEAAPYFSAWIEWLAVTHPELGITADTEWKPVFVTTLLVASHYAYWSEEWELTLAWHNMIPPDDWTEVHLRRRGVETAPSLAWRRDSVKGATEPHEVAPPDSVVR